MSPLLIPLGLVIGLALGALGGGGSMLTIPALVYVLGLEPGTATTSSLLIVGATSLIGLAPHLRAGRVRVAQGLMFGAHGTAGSYAGSLLSSHVAPAVLLTAFAGLMLVVATVMLVRSVRGPGSGEGADLSREPIVTLRPVTCACPRLAKLLVAATAVGLLTGFFGVGGGFLLVPALVLALSFPMPVAVGTSLLVIAINSATALLSRVSTIGTDLDWPLIAGFTAAAVVGSLVGGKVAARIPAKVLSRTFAGLVLAVAVYTAANSVPALL
ncbi:sulfite exporter TauE/SafE family protein [Knoellia subterranea]|uniref:Probable membrane transporter protein n=1 Tax=Knoellia subterranea KCTC 19937 TaxID=1385521 RepID=A0A0A0JNR2_9MICO|nr:sulfite exporter TauE/SafE family protein [Knoellia subterranea]KGN39020.1 membrane protein [Knoellia subterranea KCTC 19937]